MGVMKVVGVRGFVVLGIVVAACGGRSTRDLASSGMGDDDDSSPGTGASARGGSGGSSARGGSGGSGAHGAAAPDPENGGGQTRGGTGGSEVRGGIVYPTPGTGGSGATAAVAGSGGVTSPPREPGGCTQDNIRFSVGGNLGQRIPPAGSCVQNNMYYCAGESYTLDSGPCIGTCTCLGDTTWGCSFDNTPDGSCEVDHCEVSGERVEIGFGYVDSDPCAYCQCTRHGFVCTDDTCQATARCRDVQGEYALALARASECDPKSSVPQCAERATVSASCSDEVAVTDSAELDDIKRRFAEDGCVEISPPCDPHVSLGGAKAACAPDGYCRGTP